MNSKPLGVQQREQAKRFRELAAAKDWPGYIAALSPDHDEPVKRIARSVLRTALMRSKEGIADDILVGLTPDAILALELPLAEVRGYAEALMHAHDMERLEALLADAAEVAPDDPVIAGLQLRLLGRLNRIGAIRRIMRLRPRAFENPEALLAASDYVGMKSDDHERLVSYLEDLPAESGTAIKLQGIRWLYRAGEEDRAVLLARRYRGNAETSDFDGILDMLTNVPACQPRLEASGLTPNVMVGHSEGDRGALIFFNGFGIPGRGRSEGSVLDRYISDLGLTTITVKDPSHLLCLKGIPDFAESIEEAAAGLREIVTDLGLEKIYTMGGSAGGYSAVVYGLHLRAEAALLFGSPTDCGPGNANVDFRAQVVARKLQRNFDTATLDMLSWLDAFDDSLPITHYYSADNGIDSWHAARIADRPGVHSIALKGQASHQVMVEAAKGRTLGQVLREGLSLTERGRSETVRR
ncbi:hypothetical protein [Parasphingopyxis marina]|uniref:Alpha/beta hydrolase n=1 Tax=Parasphingopyxis marina TaxID=2761622 RepID=A0A842HXX4_9SPHN|nr:hypothetical protein [Parasphingopyxis marina]MBC2777792.1 hypothetical protein [Parasphingopyxis marina]